MRTDKVRVLLGRRGGGLKRDRVVKIELRSGVLCNYDDEAT